MNTTWIWMDCLLVTPHWQGPPLYSVRICAVKVSLGYCGAE